MSRLRRTTAFIPLIIALGAISALPGAAQGAHAGFCSAELAEGASEYNVIYAVEGTATQGTNGDDLICGRGGNDTLSGGNGDDVVWGDQGNDVVNGNNGDDAIFGANVGQDGAATSDTCDGGRGADTDRGTFCDTSTNIEATTAS